MLFRSEEKSGKIKKGDFVSLRDISGGVKAVMIAQEFFSYNKEFEAQKVYKTIDASHPGVK